jgi:hypothetical protein
MQELLDAQAALVSSYPKADQWLKTATSYSKKYANHPIWKLVSRRDAAIRSLLDKLVKLNRDSQY